LKNGKQNGLMSYEQLRELLQMTALQTSENAKQIREMRKEFQDELRKSAKEHDKEMKEIRTLFKAMIKRIAV
jgi:hypothetical protein